MDWDYEELACCLCGLDYDQVCNDGDEWGKHKEPPYKRTIAVYYPLGGGRVELVERSEKTGTPSVNGSYQDQIDEYGLPVISTSHRAAMICNYYSVRATMYMDIADPTEEEIEYANSARK